MIKKNKFQIILSSVIMLLPMLFGIIMWNELPDIIATHFGASGNADGFSGKAFAVFGVPAVFLVLQALTLLITALDKGQKEQSPKALSMIFWIIPTLSLFINTVMYSVVLGKDFHLPMLIPTVLGILFIVMGNYMPKVKKNSTLGVKLSWALRNEENWNKTHRFSGKLMVVGGFMIMACALFPFPTPLIVLICVLVAYVIATTLYSYSIYRQHQKQGIAYAPRIKGRTEKAFTAIGAIVIPVMLIGIAVAMFTGDITVRCEDSSLQIDATYWTDIEVAYDELDSVEYRDELDVGMRTNGYNSARLLLGIFRNDEFGSYTIYAYTDAAEYVVLTSGEKTLVIGMRDAQDTHAIYTAISKRIEGN